MYGVKAHRQAPATRFFEAVALRTVGKGSSERCGYVCIHFLACLERFPKDMVPRKQGRYAAFGYEARPATKVEIQSRFI
jgi:hypothetical protein